MSRKVPGSSFVDPRTMFWDPEFWPNLDPDPDPRVVLSILRIKVKIFKVF